MEYLFKRGIDYEIIDDCIQKGLLFESEPYHNAVFVGCDGNGTPRYAAYRACSSKRLMGDAAGSDKHYSFHLIGTNEKEVHLFESAIDALSFATLCKMQAGDWRSLNLVSLAGVYAPGKNPGRCVLPAALWQYLVGHPNTTRLILHLDNDEAGRQAVKVICHRLAPYYEIVDSPAPLGKDVNDFLCLKLGIKQKERSQER